jgi:hypothetical protein
MHKRFLAITLATMLVLTFFFASVAIAQQDRNGQPAQVCTIVINIIGNSQYQNIENPGSGVIQYISQELNIRPIVVQECIQQIRGDDDGNNSNDDNNNNSDSNDTNSNTSDTTTDATADTTTPETTTANGGSGSDSVRNADAFRCEFFLRSVRDDTGALKNQYRGDEVVVQRFEQCLSADVLASTIPDRNLPFTGGMPLLGLAALGLASMVAGASVLRAVTRRGR